MFEITRGKQKTAQKVVIYGPEGVGKSTFASQFPNPLFVDTEGSTKELDVARLPCPTSWAMLAQELQHVKDTHPCKTLVVDTIDWAEQLCTEAVCAKHNKGGVEDFGYGMGYVYVKEEFGRFLNRLEEIIEDGIHVVLTAHAQIRKFEQPDEMGAYDRYELKLGKKTGSQTSPLVKEWADMVLFANYKTLSVAVDDKGKKHKAQGGRRMMYTAHHPCWDAKNRHDLAEELRLCANRLCIPELSPAPEKETASNAQDLQTTSVKKSFPAASEIKQAEEQPKEQPIDPEVPEPVERKEPVIDDHQEALNQLFDLIDRNGYDQALIQWAVTNKGYYPADTPIQNYATDFIKGVLIAAWDQVDKMIKERLETEIPF